MSCDAYGSFSFVIPYKDQEARIKLDSIVGEAELHKIYPGVGWQAGRVLVDHLGGCVIITSDLCECYAHRFTETLENFCKKLRKEGFDCDKVDLYYEVDGDHFRCDFNDEGDMVFYCVDNMRRFSVETLDLLESIGRALESERIRNRKDFVGRVSLDVEEIVESAEEHERVRGLQVDEESMAADTLAACCNSLYRALGLSELVGEDDADK